MRKIRRPDPWVYVMCDYATLEMRTLAQTNLDLFGSSPLAESLISGRDPHTDLACELLNQSYETVKARVADEDAVAKDHRQFCFHPDTEALTPTGWKRIADLQLTDTVAAAIPENGAVRIEWQHPTALTSRQADEIVHLKTEGIDLRVTRDHRMLAFKNDGTPYVTTPEELPKARGWYNAGTAPGGSWDPDEKLLRLAVATQADGSYVGEHVHFGFTKERKIERMRALLADTLHDERKRGDGATLFVVDKGEGRGRPSLTNESRIIKSLLSVDKTFDDRWLNLSSRGRQIVLDEVQHWDATCRERSTAFTYFSMIKKNCDVVQILATLEGRKTRLAQDKTNGMWQLTVRSHETRKNDRSRGGLLEPKVLPYGGDVVCLTVPSSFVVVRDGGIPVIAGNCKIGNYGFGGGMAPGTFVDYARGYGIEIPMELSERLHAAFRDRWSMWRFFDHVSELLGARGEATIVHPRTGMTRGRVGYCAACNHYFQHPAAIGAKRALYQVQKECWIKKYDSPLYGCKPVMFLHDEIIMEVPYADFGYVRADQAARRLATVMREQMETVVPDVPIETDLAMARKWYKGAGKIEVDGYVVPSKPIKVEDPKKPGKLKTVWVPDLDDTLIRGAVAA